MTRQYDKLLFLTGLFAMTEVHIGGFIAISEIAIFIIAPFVFLQDSESLRRDGFGKFLLLSFLCVIGCVISSTLNATPFPFFARGIAATYSIFAGVVCMHRLLRDDFGRIRFFFVGYALSIVINIFAFQRGSARHAYDTALISFSAMEATANSVLFWSSRLPYWLYLPFIGWFPKTPFFYAVGAPFCVAIVSLLASGGSGRAAALTAFVTACLILFLGKERNLFFKRRSRTFLIVLLATIVPFAAGRAYSFSVKKGMLGEAAIKKYETQTKEGSSAIDILKRGRSEFFIGLYAACRRPIVGYGPWAIDKEGIVGDYMAKHGLSDDYADYERRLSLGRMFVVPSHSCIVGFWTWYGILGLTLWIYILYLCWKTVSLYYTCYYPWFGCVATMIPIVVWDAFFSPFGNRVMMGLFFSMCLYLKAVYEQRIPPGGMCAINRLPVTHP